MSSKDNPSAERFQELLRQLNSTELSEFEAAFEALRHSIKDVKPYLMTAMVLAENSEVKGALLELMGNTKDPQFIPFIANELESDVARVRFWAWVALQYIATDEARRIICDFDTRTLRRRSTVSRSCEH